MEERLLAVLRRPEVLVGLVSRRRRPFDPSTASPEPYVDVPLALSQVLITTCPWKDKDCNTWRALANVPRMTERAMLAVVRTLIGSVSDPSHNAELAPLDPKALPRDLRPYLCHPDGEAQLLDGIRDDLAAATEGTELPKWHWSRRRDIAGLPGEFRRLFLWSLHLRQWEQVLEVLAAYETLELDVHPGLRSAVARLLCFSGPEVTVAWCGLLHGLEPGRRTRALELVLESRARDRMPVDQDQEILATGDDRSALRSLG